MLQRFREGLSLILIALLPLHALMVTVFTRVIAGPGNAPISLLALWKEALLGVILIVALCEFIQGQVSGKRLAASRLPLAALRFDLFDGLILALLVLSLTVTALTHGDWGLYALGFRYDFVPLVAFLILRRAPWSDVFRSRAAVTLLAAGTVIALYGIVSSILPAGFFHWLGYSDLHSLYVPGRPLAAFQQIGGSALRRIQSTMSGPNQLGIWLMIPLGIVLSQLSANSSQLSVRKISGFLLILFGVALLLTFSRAAWIGTAVMFAVAVWPLAKRMKRGAIIGVAASVIGLAAAGAFLFPDIILRVSSTRGHIENPIAAVQTMMRFPFGRGLAMAGPASNRVSDACVMLREDDDASWAADRPDLCIFLGNTQVQPVDRACVCPFLPENWYLQIGVEMGWVGFVLFLCLIGLLLYRLRDARYKMQDTRILDPEFWIFFSFLGVSVAALFLHAWEDAATAYTLWLLSATLPAPEKRWSWGRG